MIQINVRRRLLKDQSSVAAGAATAGAAGAAGTGESWIGFAFGAACFFAAVEAGDERAAGGLGWAFAAAGGDRGAGGAVAVAGSGVMMLTGGVDAALGNSALVGLPVGNDAGKVAVGGMTAAAGAFHDDE